MSHKSEQCPQCDSKNFFELSSYFQKRCVGCGHVVSWPLKEGQAPLIANNRCRSIYQDKAESDDCDTVIECHSSSQENTVITRWVDRTGGPESWEKLSFEQKESQYLAYILELESMQKRAEKLLSGEGVTLIAQEKTITLLKLAEETYLEKISLNKKISSLQAQVDHLLTMPVREDKQTV